MLASVTGHSDAQDPEHLTETTDNLTVTPPSTREGIRRGCGGDTYPADGWLSFPSMVAGAAEHLLPGMAVFSIPPTRGQCRLEEGLPSDSSP